MDRKFIVSALREGTIRLEGRFLYGLNYTFLVDCAYRDQDFRAVYKPLQGERILWDFPPQTLAKREVAAYLISEGLEWGLVPPTIFRTKNAPMGAGSLQLFIDHIPDHHYFNFSQADMQKLPEVILFDLLINNADRKAGHLLIDPEGELWLIDHGVSFHEEDKLRTVIWDLAGQPINQELLRAVRRLSASLSEGRPFRHMLESYLTVREIEALGERSEALLKKGHYPIPPEDRRAYPWPLV